MAMNKNEQFVLSEQWSKKLKNNLRSFYRTTYWGPPTFALLNAMFCFAFQRGTQIGFWALYIPLTILSTLYCILLPQKAIRRYRNIIQAFEFKSESEMTLTLIDGRILTLSKPEVKDGIFKVGNSEKACKSVIDNFDKSDYTIIPEFFTHSPIV
jgi:hypothetical protein